MLNVFSSRASVCPLPFWMMRQAGRYLPEYQATRKQAGGFLNLCLTPSYAAEVTLQPIHRFGLSAAILFSDILMVPYGLGQPLEFLEGEGPVLGSLDCVDTNRLPQDFLARLAPVFEAVRHVRQTEPHVPLIGFAGGPWTVACYMIQGRVGHAGCFEAKAFAYRHPDIFRALLDLLIQATLCYLSAQIEAGCQIIQLFESAAGALSPSEMEEWVLEPHQHMVERLRAAHPHVPIIGFPRGVGHGVIAYALATGVDGVSIDAMVSAEDLRKKLPHTVIQGGLHPDLLRIGGEPLLREVDRLCTQYESHPYILNLSHGVHPQTPVEHVSQVVAHLRQRHA